MGDGTLIAPDWVLTAAHVAIGFTQREGVRVEGEAPHRITAIMTGSR
jgi:hypothetical protein